MVQRIIKQYTPLLVLVLVSFILTDLFIPKISHYYNLLSSFILAFIFLGSTILVNFKIHNNPKRFIGNFLVMTTLQLLAFLIYELVLIFQEGNWWVALHALFTLPYFDCFSIHRFIQTQIRFFGGRYRII